jgi:fatty acid desaturase
MFIQSFTIIVGAHAFYCYVKTAGRENCRSVISCFVFAGWQHVQEDCQRPRTGDADDFFRWQIESAVDYSVASPLVPKLTASLSLQSMHHVFPSVCGCHFHKLYPEFAAICETHGVRMNTRTDVSHAWRTAIARIFELSSPELTPKWALEPPPTVSDDAEALDRALGALREHGPILTYFLTPAVAFLVCSPFF